MFLVTKPTKVPYRDVAASLGEGVKKNTALLCHVYEHGDDNEDYEEYGDDE